MHVPPIAEEQLDEVASATRHVDALPSSWQGELELWLESRNGKTRLIRRRHFGPLIVQQPFNPEADGTCHIYLLHPPGGIAEGDKLETKIHLGQGARTLLTTPGATKFYRCQQGGSEQRILIDVGGAAVCEFFPQETILFDGADAMVETRVCLAADATYVGWDLVCLGRPAAQERFTSGRVSLRTEVLCEGKPVWFERLGLSGGSPLSRSRYALADQPIFGTMIYVGQTVENAADRVRDALEGHAGDVFSVSQLEKVVVCRYLGPRISQARTLFARAWDVLRTACQGKPASPPRIWAT
ncbi:urease accessory protein UreD [Rhizobium mesoamericanum]|uniref:Urease accessory protein UreD n=1 Tax=Rhizobium mesoamericanum STM3625 TaxID=1211777 RepID=K0Q279_9HYPH|nr:urease accessory protein UreD [Rhizobium mesoamericanum]CCM78540.1 Urease accessory protein ureD 2 [Rhizobium mesoamericanum STM3625]